MVNKKINIIHIMIIFLQCCLIILNGSRSPLLRLITMIIILMYVFSYRKHEKRKGSFKFFFQLIGIVMILLVVMIVILYIIGRNEKIGRLTNYFFVYTGAPIVNLDTYLNSGVKFFTGSSELFGAQTFKGIYAYVGKIFKIDKFLYKGIGAFAFNPNGIEIGNVYTTFYKFIYDFGYIGVLPLSGIIAWYYTSTYKKILKYPSIKVIDYRLFIYSYLFNDLIMLAFSNRFFETILDAPFLKFLLISWILDGIILERKLRIEKMVIKIVAMKGVR